MINHLFTCSGPTDLLVLTDQTRYRWKHSMAARLSDPTANDRRPAAAGFRSLSDKSLQPRGLRTIFRHPGRALRLTAGRGATNLFDSGFRVE